MTRIIVALGALLLAAADASAANVVLVNLDFPGEGLNDPTPATPVGGNPGTTVGEQRIHVYQRALDLWGATLDSPVPIYVGAYFESQLSCSATSAVLGSAGTTFVFSDFPGAEFPGVWYHSALADAMSGADQEPGNVDIIARFNPDLGDPDCLAGSGWYYGLDHQQGNLIDFLAVVLHEIDHGLGHANFANEATGALFNNMPDVYTLFTRDTTLGLTWDVMTDAERQFSATNDRKVVWDGLAVNAVAAQWLGPLPELLVDGIGRMEAQPAAFGPVYRNERPSAKVVLGDDGTGAPNDGCEPLVNNVWRRIVLVDRGGCTFVQKVQNAQDAGAVGVVVANNQPTGLTPMGGSSATITIPSIGITQASGDALKAEMIAEGPDEVEAKFMYSETLLSGTEAGMVRIYAPPTVALGSSGSHWDVSATPNLLMEPFINADLDDALDLSPALLEDEGWVLSP